MVRPETTRFIVTSLREEKWTVEVAGKLKHLVRKSEQIWRKYRAYKYDKLFFFFGRGGGGGGGGYFQMIKYGLS